MAKASTFTTQFTILLLLSSSLSIFPVSGKESDDQFVRTMDRKLLGIKKEKLSHFKIYWHDIITGPSPSSIQIVPPPKNTSRLAFGLVRMMDNPLTLGPELSSKMVGRAQGFYAQASQEGVGLLMAMNFGFIEAPSRCRGEQGVFGGEGDAGDRRKWAFPVCQRVCSGKNSDA
ncbi:hypothetical protein K2173_010935 [Erythroxylum novogranatense]|uniref:Dirigent protein n=1 Tax=Erythroxylum novogranatense TaxID=1862640 RepID=A0AAV8T1U2_9ROSI|nr:hypothetical protein K2173_010935 [Erythroxylum novogranatense]